MEEVAIQEPLLLIWGKLNSVASPPSTDSIQYHPLICHMLDVSGVLHRMWETCLAPSLRAWITSAVSLPERQSLAWLQFLAASHDIGKATPAFQRKHPAWEAELARCGLPVPQASPDAVQPHGTLSTAVLTKYFEKTYRMSLKEAFSWASITGGHHGQFPLLAEIKPHLVLPNRSSLGSVSWDSLRTSLLQVISTTTGLQSSPPRPPETPLALILAGLISVADWIASNQDLFPCRHLMQARRGPFDGLAYAQRANDAASSALNRLGWISTPSRRPLSFEQLFPGRSPRPAQAQVEKLVAGFSEPAALLIEAPMGEGKTEIALQAADTLGSACGQPGLYVGLPTQATSNQMFSRVRSFLADRFPGSPIVMILAHGHASITSEFLEMIERGEQLFSACSVGDQPLSDGTDSVVAASWFGQRKRPLLAPVGVGTIDQALLSVLITRHLFVRIFALSGKTLVIDEIHAYDAYTSTLLERLLEWMGALGCTVILLSATLPRAKALRLLQSWAAGRRIPSADLALSPYPRASWIGGGVSQGSASLAVSPRLRRSLDLQFVEDDETALIRLLDLLRDGGCAVVIRNTVTRAQETYRRIQQLNESGDAARRVKCRLFHARFVHEDRQRIESETLAAYGPDSQSRPERSVLVATQVVEQSLDLDFDLMLSDHAPVDLLLQRSGRLHRHHRTRPPGLQTPVLWILQPKSQPSGLPRFDRGSSNIYQPSILFASWVALKNRAAIAIPADVDPLIESVYGDGGLHALSSEFSAHLNELRRKDAEATQALEQQAEDRYIPKPHSDEPLDRYTRNALEEDDPTVHPKLQAATRLSEPNIQIVCLYGTPQKAYFDKDLSQPLPPGGLLSGPVLRRLLARSLTLSDRRLVPLLAEAPVPRDWQSSHLLRYHRALYFDSNGRSRIGSVDVAIDSVFGFRVLDSAEPS